MTTPQARYAKTRDGLRMAHQEVVRPVAVSVPLGTACQFRLDRIGARRP